MRVCLDTNVLLQLFKADPTFNSLRAAMINGDIEVAFSNDMWLEYEEVIIRSCGVARWQRTARFLDRLKLFRGNIVQVEPTFRFTVIAADPDDDKFVDCAIVSGADYLVTEDRHFAALVGSGYRPQPITPQAFVSEYLPQ